MFVRMHLCERGGKDRKWRKAEGHLEVGNCDTDISSFAIGFLLQDWNLQNLKDAAENFLNLCWWKWDIVNPTNVDEIIV